LTVNNLYQIFYLHHSLEPWPCGVAYDRCSIPLHIPSPFIPQGLCLRVLLTSGPPVAILKIFRRSMTFEKIILFRFVSLTHRRWESRAQLSVSSGWIMRRIGEHEFFVSLLAVSEFSERRLQDLRRY
jgi:hypothetical protein